MKTILEQYDFVKFNEPMSNYTSYKTGGIADIVALPENAESLKAVLTILREYNMPVYLFGNCTNILVRDKGIRGAVILTGRLNDIEVEGNFITASAGVSMAKLAATAYEASLTGAEAVSGIPGSVGGAVSMNAGSYGTSIEDILVSSQYLDENLNICTLQKEQHQFGYRTSFFTDKNYVILNSTFAFTHGDKKRIKRDMLEYARKRKSSQPLEYPSCGSVFKRPVGHFAGKLIQDAGLKGYTVNGAQVSEKHAGFIINKGGATSKDILAIIDYIKSVVYNKYKVNLELEVKIIGEE